MKFLALKFAAPMQSWGSSSRFSQRATESFPTKSGVIGLLASAMGITREDAKGLRQFDNLDIVVREDKRGSVLRDYHVVDVSRGKGNKKLSERFYLTDASFLVGIYSPHGDEGLIEDIARAVQSPEHAPFLGRKSCPPAGRVFISVSNFDSVDSFLTDTPLTLDNSNQIPYRDRALASLNLRAVVSDLFGGDVIMDQPKSFSSAQRSYLPRPISEITVTVPNSFIKKSEDHDAFAITES